MSSELHFQIRTPHETVLDARVESARVPSETGQAGLRAGEEPLILVVEPGLVVLRFPGSTRFAATAGGLLESNREQCVLYTPFAVVGDVDSEVVKALDDALVAPNSELSARRRLGELEQRIVQELRHRPRVARARSEP